MDRVDRQIVRCLQLSPRTSFRSIADVLSLSEQTVARRYRRLVRAGQLRVVALLRPTAVGQHNWLVRAQVRPDGAQALAAALAQRDDTSWVAICSGGAEIVCAVRARSDRDRDELLVQRLPRTGPVLGMSVAMVLHRFVGPMHHPRKDWSGLRGELTDEQEEAIAATWDYRLPVGDPRFDLRPADLRLIDALAADGRASFAVLAKASGLSETQAGRRLRALIDGGALYLDVDVSMTAIGLTEATYLWLTVAPAQLHAAGQAFGGEPEVGFAAAITGPQNLVVSVIHREVGDLYRFITDKVGAVEGIQSMQTAPTLRNVKQAGAILVEPTTPRRAGR